MAEITALIFDLDGTLYVNQGMEDAIHQSSLRYLSLLKGVDHAGTSDLLRATREGLAAQGRIATLSHAILLLGGDLQDLHAHFAADIDPSAYLVRDDRVVGLLTALAGEYDLYVYTNNNPTLSNSILALLGIAPLFRRVFTIQDTWRPKPDRGTLEYIFRAINRVAADCLFVGDRADVDLSLPGELGSTTCLVKTVEELLSLQKLLAETSA